MPSHLHLSSSRIAGVFTRTLGCLLVLLSLKAASYANGPVCVKGVADLRNIDIQTRGAAKLDGEWEFYWNQLLQPGQKGDALQFSTVPSMWLANGQEAQGYATYRLRVLLPPDSKNFGIKIPEFSTAFSLWVNGTEVASSGTVSSNPQQGQAAYETRLIHLGQHSDTLDLVLQVSNYHFYTGGFPQSVLIGDYEVLDSIRQSQIAFGSMLFGILLIIGIFHLGIYFFRPKEKYNLFYSLYCLLLAVNTLFVTERWVFALAGPSVWPLLYKLYIAMIYLVLLALILFYSEFFKAVIGIWVRRVMSAIFILEAILVLILPTHIGSWLEPFAAINLLAAGFIAIFIFAKAIWQGKEGAIVIAVCNFVFIFSFILDGMLSTNQISGIHLSHYVTVLYVISISLVLSRRIASAFNNVEALSVGLQSANDELSHLNKNLEDEVKDRTRQVLQQEKMAALGQLTANIAHEINTPMGAIKASVETLSVAYRNSLDLFPGAIDALTLSEREALVGMLLHVLTQPGTVSSREERQLRKALIQSMKNAGIADAETLAPKFTHAGLTELNETQLALLRKPGIQAALQFLFENFEQITAARNIQAAIERVTKIMFAIKLYSRGGASNAKSLVNLEQELQATIILYNSWFRKGIQLETDFGQMKPLLCFAGELQQVWTNLILNAVQAMGSTGTLEIVAKQEGNNALVTVADTGPGIPAEIINKIFDPFFTTKGSGEGSGLGLDIVRTIVTRHEGTITVQSQPGKTVFTVAIPYLSE